ncbi:MAG: DNA translocase FtsK 4TM domain-containing protein, partial [Ignavibacteria bacterium]|nr:DNA translocase FtsK 4TM domain-containing protein [Ignavibacteria bacterium]
MSKTGNKLKANILKDPEVVVESPSIPVEKPKKKEKVIKPKTPPDGRYKKIIGVFFLFMAVYFALAFFSFFLNWFNQVTDDYFSDLPIGDVLTDTQMRISNWTGNLGAFFSQFLVKDGFGLGAFYFVFISIVFGIRLISSYKVLSAWGIWKFALMCLLWLPLLFAFLFPEDPLNVFGGVMGAFLNNYLTAILGKVGVAITLTFVFLVFLILSFSLTFIKKDKAKKESNLTPGGLIPQDRYNTVEYAVDEEDEDIEFVKPIPGEGNIQRVTEDSGIDLEIELPENAIEIETLVPEEEDEYDEDLELNVVPSVDEKVKTRGTIERQGIDTQFDPT